MAGLGEVDVGVGGVFRLGGVSEGRGKWGEGEGGSFAMIGWVYGKAGERVGRWCKKKRIQSEMHGSLLID